MAEKKKETSSGVKTRVLIVDDHWVVVNGIKAALEEHEEFEVAGTASDGLQAVKSVKSLKPDIVIMDISMPNLNGIGATYDIKKFNKNIRIVIFSMFSDKEYVLSLFRAGISGYILKEESVADLILALKSVRGGGTYYSKSIQKTIQEHMEDLELGHRKTAREIEDGLIRLSVREKEVFPLLADGLSAKEIAERLGISPKTAESHKYNIMEKLNATSVADLTKIALKKNLIKL
jgi:DNA-binding NarL/FixJ family response regulator